MNTASLKGTVAGLAIVTCCATAVAKDPANDTIATAKGALTIHAIHHASMMLSWNGLHVLIDPAPAVEGPKAADPAAEYRSLPKPDVIVITHGHFDHFSVPILEAVAGAGTKVVAPQAVRDAMPADLQAKTEVMKNGDSAVVDGIPVEAVAAYNITPDRLKFHPKGTGNGYILTFGGKRVYVAGDTEETPELAHLSGIDVAFLPINLPYTETEEAAVKWVRDFKPRIVYPYHYHNQDGTLTDVTAFKKDVAGTSDVRLLRWY
jgi:L-ascorbate metabolism protein UlaG (beta-lactamase superfamily)